MVAAVHDAQGQPIHLGRELGRGGEGVVHELPSHPDWVAKRYHQAPDAAKQQKLRLMAESIDSPLRNYAAWPEETLHLGENGPVIGFTMQRIEGRLPIHMLYSPAQRRESFPQARFDFLVFVARNIAAAFATLHEHGHVLGDVNQGNVLVGADSRVILIDCDSFQIQVGDALHRCEVGVAHFTPPELQSIASFEDITRTPNHDGFGLALLIFHLLMGGRHPYSGVPLADHIGESLEADIRDFRYAYAKDAAQRLIAPPPKSVPIDSLPPAIVALFEQAFTERGVAARPTPQQWVGALDGLRAGLVQCAKRAAHIHAGHAQECAWCVLERRRVRLFGALDKPRSARKSTRPASPPIPERPAFDVGAMAAAVGKMNPPQRVPVPWYPPLRAPDPEQNIEARAMGLGATVGIFSGVCGMLLVASFGMGAADGLLIFLPLLLLSVVLGFIVSTFGLHYFGRRFREYEEAYSQFRRLHERLASLAEEINDATAVAAVDEWRNAERALRQFEAKEATALAQFKLDAADGGLRRFLQGKLIEHWREPRLSRLERVRLRAAGIETAADFDRARLVKAHLLRDDARAALSAWKLQLVRDYRRQAPTAAPGLADFHRARAQHRIALQERLGAVYAKLEKSMQRGSLVLAARRNQMAALQAEAMRQHAHCEQLARLLPPPPRRPGSVLP